MVSVGCPSPCDDDRDSATLALAEVWVWEHRSWSQSLAIVVSLALMASWAQRTIGGFGGCGVLGNTALAWAQHPDKRRRRGRVGTVL